MNISEIKPYPKNAKKHPKKQVEQIANSIKEFGFNQPVVIDKKNVVIVGHGRLEAARLLGLSDVPVVQVDLTEAQAKAYRLADNKLNESAWEMDLVIAELKELESLGFDIDLTGFDRDLLISPDEKDDLVPENVETRCKAGDLWQLGKHRLLCGDSTKREDVERLMDGKKADMVFTDPPYRIITFNRFGAKANRKYDSVIKPPEFSDWMPLAVEFSNEDSVLAVFEYWKNIKELWIEVEKNGFWIANLAIYYATNRHSLFAQKYLYSKYDPIVIGVRNKYHWNNVHAKNVGTADVIAHSVSSRYSSGQNKVFGTKPIEVLISIIPFFSFENDLMYEPFSGSGSTLIAAEKTGRICYGMEIDEKYCDVILKRFEDYAKTKAEKIG